MTFFACHIFSVLVPFDTSTILSFCIWHPNLLVKVLQFPLLQCRGCAPCVTMPAVHSSCNCQHRKWIYIYTIGSLVKRKCWGAWKLQLEGLSHINEATIPGNYIYFCCAKLGKFGFLGPCRPSRLIASKLNRRC